MATAMHLVAAPLRSQPNTFIDSTQIFSLLAQADEAAVTGSLDSALL